MQALVILLFFIVALSSLSLTSTEDSQAQQMRDTHSEASAYQFETFARAAWFLARSGASGTLDRGAMALPSGYPAQLANTFQARTDGAYLYVWQTSARPEEQRPELIFPTADISTDVGISGTGTIAFRRGGSATLPSWIPPSKLVVRMRI